MADDLIRRVDALRAIIKADYEPRDACYEVIKDIPAVDAVEVRHGYFFEDEHSTPGDGRSNYVCSVCGKFAGSWRSGLEPTKMFHYCPWCGARMDGRREDEPDA